MNTLKGTAKFTPLAYANLEIAPDDPDAFDIERVAMYAMRISDVHPCVECFTVEHTCTECEELCFTLVFNTIDEACNKFKEIIKRSVVTKVAVSKDIDDYLYDDEPYVRSSTYGDYSPSNPWDAPGMSVSDFLPEAKMW